MYKEAAYVVETLGECLDEMKPLLEKHWEEIALHKDKIELNPDYDKYQEMEDAGTLHIVTARIGGRLVGYFISFIMLHPHYKDHSFAVNDILFVDMSYRRTTVGVGMFKYAENKLKEMGVSVIMVSMKTHAPFDQLCESLGYDNVERNYSKYIGE